MTIRPPRIPSGVLLLLTAFLIAGVPEPVSAQTIEIFTSAGQGKTGMFTHRQHHKQKPAPNSPAGVDAQRVWNNTGTNFNAGGSWVGGTAPVAGDVAAFNATAGTQPQLNANTSISGLYFTGTGTSGYTLTRTGTPTLTLTGYATSIGGETGDGDAVAIGAENTSGTNTVSVPFTLAPAVGSTSTIFQAGGGTLALSGVITGSGINLTKTGAGTLTLSGNNTFSGGVTIKGGTLSATTNANALGSGTMTLGDTSGSASATLLGDGRAFANSITVAAGSSGTLTIGNSGNSSAVFSGAVTLNNGLTLTASGTGSVKLTGGVTGTGDIVLNNTTNGAVTFWDTTSLNNAGTITNSSTGTGGVTTINTSRLGGNVTQLIQNSSTSSLTLSMTTNTAFVGSVAVNAGTLFLGSASALSSSNEVSVAAGATFDINAQNQTIAGLNGGTGTVTNSGGAKTLTLGGSGSYSFAGTITATNTNNMNILKSGSGIQTLSGTNMYTGTTTVSSGVLKLASANALPGGIGSTGGSGPLVLNEGVIGLANGDFSRPLGATGTNGAVNLTGGGGFAAYGADRIVNLGGASAGVTWNAGNFVGNGNTFILGASSADQTLDFQNPLSLGTAGTNTRTIQVDDGSAAIDAKLSGLVTGTATNKLQKTGTGTLALTANNTYLGATQIDAGTLYINGDQTSATGAVTVNNAGTVLGGTGTIGGAVTVGGSNAAAILEGGTGSTGVTQKLTLANNLTMNSGSIIELALGPAGAHSTLARTGGTWSFASTQQFTFIDLGATTGTYQDIITGLASNPLTTSTFTFTNAGYMGTFSWDGANIDLNLTAVPEPGTWCAGALALGALLFAQRRRFETMAFSNLSPRVVKQNRATLNRPKTPTAIS